VTARQDLPGYSGNQETEALGLLEVQRYLVTQGFKVTEVAGRFDDGLDLLLSPHDEKNVLPAIAGIQVRSGCAASKPIAWCLTWVHKITYAAW
jgi:hypothetical protein